MNKICPKCGTVIPESSINTQAGIAMCANCKEILTLAELKEAAPPASPSLPAPVQASRFCKQCGKPLSDEVKFCAGCGAPVAASTSKAAPNIPIGFTQNLNPEQSTVQTNPQLEKKSSKHKLLFGIIILVVIIINLLTRAVIPSYNNKKAGEYFNNGISYTVNGQYDQAIKDYSEAIRLAPNDSTYYNSRAYNYLLLGTPEKGLEDANKSIQLSPNQYNYDTRGSIYRALSEYDKALADYTEALRLDPNYAFVYMNRAFTYLWKNENRTAYEADKKKALEIDPKRAADAYVDIAINWFNTGYYSDAVRFYNNALELNPGDSRILRLRAEAEAKVK